MREKFECPNCGKKEAKVSSTYQDLVVCYCGGSALNEVGTFSGGKVLSNNPKIEKNLKFQNGSFVMGIDQSYTRSVYMVMDEVLVHGWKDSDALLLKIMSFNGSDYSQGSGQGSFLVRPKSEFQVIPPRDNSLSTISKPDYKSHENYGQLLGKNFKNTFLKGDSVSSKDELVSGRVIGNVVATSDRESEWADEAVLVEVPLTSMYQPAKIIHVVAEKSLKFR